MLKEYHYSCFLLDFRNYIHNHYMHQLLINYMALHCIARQLCALFCLEHVQVDSYDSYGYRILIEGLHTL